MNGRRLLVLLLLSAFGVGLALLIGFVTLKAFGRDDLLERLLSRCTQADGDWHEIVRPLVYSYPAPCSSFYWDIYPTGEFYNLISLNNFGLHDTNVTLEKPAGTFRILMMGDSFPQGWQVKLEQGFPWLMEQALNEGANRRIEVINLAVDTYGTDRQLLMYAALGWRFQPDAVLLAFYTGNDLKDNFYPLSALDAGGTITRAVFTLDEAGQLRLHNAPELDPTRFPDAPAWRWLTGMTQAQTPLPDFPLPDKPRVKNDSPYELEYPVDLGLYLPPDENWSAAWALTEALLRQFRDLVEQQGSRFGIIVIPDRRAVHPSDWDTTVSLFPFVRDADPFAPGDRIEVFLGKEGIPFLNLTYTLRGWASSHAGERLYYVGDGHFNANGHQVAAQRIVFWLREAGLVR